MKASTSRLVYLSLAFVTMLLGLGSRASGIKLPDFFATYAGDTLWALLVFWLIRALKPNSSLILSALIALCFSYAIEISQFYQAPWINALRSTMIGGLVLGFGFKLSDLACYSVGIFMGYALNGMALVKFKVPTR